MNVTGKLAQLKLQATNGLQAALALVSKIKMMVILIIHIPS